jgi:hypothetical protein
LHIFPLFISDYCSVFHLDEIMTYHYHLCPFLVLDSLQNLSKSARRSVVLSDLVIKCQVLHCS